MSDALTVGQVAKRCGIKVSALHFYEQKGLISSQRNSGNQRRYHRDVLRRVAVIKAAQKVGMSLRDIQQAFATLPSQRALTQTDWATMSASWQQQLEQRISYLQGLRDSLTGCIGCGCLSMQRCPLYNPDDMLSSEGQGAVLLDRKAPDL